MDRESVERLRFDRRLQRRRGWLEDGQLESHVEALPDVVDKMTTIAEAEEEAKRALDSASREEPAPAAPSFGSQPPASHPEPALTPARPTGLGGGSFGSDPVGGGFGSDGSDSIS